MFRARWGRALNAKIRILAFILEAVGSHLTFLAVGLQAELHFREIKTVGGWKEDRMWIGEPGGEETNLEIIEKTHVKNNEDLG